MELVGNSVNIVNDQNKSASLDAEFMSKVLAEIMERILTAPYCASHVIPFGTEHPYTLFFNMYSLDFVIHPSPINCGLVSGGETRFALTIAY